ncbi:SDR family NAD(P)-dependent oxidoreductase [Streptomyces alanosinicus]|uniref:2-deoxy-D-gluconate 3-dehydrogenase n=1 Tax=Streptomyces alanosinicus TaxID=68171 RepID=A0A918YJ10_9ACTN|nr:SDR family NAD(P)-dependent oxidoreductase [Streptomyces alanosinicus]GHE05665.1 2-deoxy-D-gluconate 3-dehydrogenase [Streptomyces alanosinicus]
MNAMDLFRLDGARVLVTGASRGIGAAVARGLADAGCDLVLTARTLPALDGTVRAVVDRGRRAVALDGDLAEPDVAADLVDRAATALGGLDVVVHNAGIVPTAEDGSPVLAPLQHARQQDWEAVVTVNLNATAALCRAAHPRLARSGRASLVLMSSVAGLVGAPMMEAYAATKAAQISLVRSLGVGWARQGIRVNALCPGWTRTDMTEFASEAEPVSDWLTSHVPLGRWATADEVVGAALFLASPASSFVTGHALVVDGGLAVPDSGLAGHPKPASPFTAA